MKVYIITEYYPATNVTINHSVVSDEDTAKERGRLLQAKHNANSETAVVLVGYQTFVIDAQG